jgi:hypothetical protein
MERGINTVIVDILYIVITAESEKIRTFTGISRKMHNIYRLIYIDQFRG